MLVGGGKVVLDPPGRPGQFAFVGADPGAQRAVGQVGLLGPGVDEREGLVRGSEHHAVLDAALARGVAEGVVLVGVADQLAVGRSPAGAVFPVLPRDHLRGVGAAGDGTERVERPRGRVFGREAAEFAALRAQRSTPSRRLSPLPPHIRSRAPS